jgi:hypothetical protein
MYPIYLSVSLERERGKETPASNEKKAEFGRGDISSNPIWLSISLAELLPSLSSSVEVESLSSSSYSNAVCTFCALNLRNQIDF